MSAGEQGTEFASFIQEELNQEYSRRDSVNSRAATSITASSGLVTVTLAVIAILKGKDFTLNGWALRWLIIALALLLMAAILAVLAGMNWKYKVGSTNTLVALTTSPTAWTSTEITARSTVSQINVQTIKTLRKGTGIKFLLLLASAYCQVAGLITLGATAYTVAR